MVGDYPWSLPWELGWRLDLLVHEGDRQGFLFSRKESRVHPGTQCTGSGVEEPGLCPSPWTAVVCWDAHSRSLGDWWAGVFLAWSVWGVLWSWPMQMHPGFVL